MNDQLAILDSVPAMPWKYKLAYLVHQFHKISQVECPLLHIFEGDEYVREIHVPRGTLFIGREHLNGHLVQLISGTVINVSEADKVEISAPYEFKSVPGYQAVFYAVTDIVGRTVHKNPEGVTDWKILEDRDMGTLEALLLRGQMVEQKLLEREAA